MSEVITSGEQGGSGGGSLLTAEQGGGAPLTSVQTGSENPYASLIQPDGSFVDGWPNLLADDRYADVRATAANYKDLPSLLKGLKDSKAAAMQRLDGMVKVPGQDAKPEDVAAYRKALGIPETPEAYAFDKVQIPQGVELDPAAIAEFQKTSHELGLTPAQAAKLVEFQAGLEARSVESFQREQAAALEAEGAKLQQAWGPKYQEKVSLAHRAAATFGLDPESPIFRSAEAVMAFAKIGESISEDKLVSGETISNRLGPEQQADDIIKNSANPLHKAYHDSTHPMHKEATARFMELMKKAFPG